MNLRAHISQTIALLLLPLLAAGCGNSGDSKAEKAVAQASTAKIVQQVSHCSRLYTTEYKISKIVVFNDEVRLKGSLFSQSFDVNLSAGQRKVAIPITVTLRGSIDLSGFSADNVRRNAYGITIVLPNPEITLTASRIDSRDIRKAISGLRTDFSAEELEAFERQGVDSIVSHIGQTDMLEQTRRSAAYQIIPLLTQLGYREDQITIKFSDDLDSSSLGRLISPEVERRKIQSQ